MAELSAFSPDGINSYNYKDAAARNMITPVFDTQTIYAVGDYCIYNNGLYKCATAHTGAWSANDFVAVSVMDEVKNASGGGGLPETTKIVTFDRQVDDFTSSIVKSVTFPVLGDSGYGEFWISGTLQAQYAGSNTKSHFIGRVPMYRRRDAPYTKYMLAGCSAAKSGSNPVVSPCFECSTSANLLTTTTYVYGFMQISTDSENLGVVKVGLYPDNTSTYKLNSAFVTINAIFA